jgi:hypothetical protein
MSDSKAIGKLITSAEVAEKARTSPSTVRYWRHIGYGPTGFLCGRRVLYEEIEVDRWLASLRDAERDAQGAHDDKKPPGQDRCPGDSREVA